MSKRKSVVVEEEEEAVRNVRAALRNPHGTSAESRERVSSAWRTLRSVATAPETQSKAKKRERKRSHIEERAKRKRAHGENTSHLENGIARSSASMRAEDKMLHDAAKLGQADLVRDLVSKGSKVSSKDKSGYSALHWASLYGHVEVVAVLLRLGAADGKRINRQNDAGNSALHLACKGNHAQVAAMLHVYKPDEYLKNAYEQSPVSLGFRKLIVQVEEIQHLNDLQAARLNAQEHQLFHSTEWRIERDSECSAPVLSGNETGQGARVHFGSEWENYDTAWKKFAERFASAARVEDTAARPTDSQTTRPPDTERIGTAETLSYEEIMFDVVPWPVKGSHFLNRTHIRGVADLGHERLLLADLHVKGAPLRSLVQQERLRWHPDKFLQLFGNRLARAHRSAILAGVQSICQLLNSFADAWKEV